MQVRVLRLPVLVLVLYLLAATSGHTLPPVTAHEQPPNLRGIWEGKTQTDPEKYLCVHIESQTQGSSENAVIGVDGCHWSIGICKPQLENSCSGTVNPDSAEIDLNGTDNRLDLRDLRDNSLSGKWFDDGDGVMDIVLKAQVSYGGPS
jgi:hypothetical protein